MIEVKINGVVKWQVNEYTFVDPQMGLRSISLTVTHPSDNATVPSFVGAYVEYEGERYDIVNSKPTAEKGIDSINYKYNLIFNGQEAELQKRKIRNLATVGVDTFISQGTSFSLYADINQFKQLLENNLKYYFGNKWTINLGSTTSESVMVSVNNMFIWDLLLKTFEYYGLRWNITGNTINIGYTPDVIQHVFDYGYSGGLVKITRTAQSEPTINRLIGVGGSRNVPINYFTNRYSDFPVDPNPISGDVNIKNIMPKVFRDSVIAGTLPYIDYVEDAVLVAADGVKEDALEPNEEIYPSIAGVEVSGLGRIDQIIAASVPTANTPDDAGYSPTFDIWVKDIGFDLADNQYTTTQDAKISFTSGMLAGYEFVILAEKKLVGGEWKMVRKVEVDTSKSYGGVASKYKITLINSSEDFTATGRMLPNSVIKAMPGDSFVIHDIIMPQTYVELAELRVQNWLNEQLLIKKVEKPTYAIEPTDTFFEENIAPESDGKTIREKLKSGNKLTVNNTKVTDGAQELHINNITIQYGGLLPKYSFVVTDKVSVQGSVTQRIQSSVRTVELRQSEISNKVGVVYSSSHSHHNKQIIDQILQQHLDVLGVLSIVDGNLKIDANAYSTGELSAYGIGSGGSSGGGVDLLQAWTDYDSTKDNWAVKAGLLVPFYNDTKSRLTSLEGGAALSLNVTGSGNAIASLTKSGTTLTAVKGNFAELDVNGKILSSQLPSYVDDVLEYVNLAAFPATGESGKIYIAIDANLTYRWSGTAYVEISASLALGETSSTAYRGDRGKIAYDHSQTEHQTIINGIGFVKANGKALSYDNNSYSLASHNHSGVYEPVLGNPSANGYLLSSSTAGARSWVAPYSLPTASASVLGGVKIGANVSIASGVISVHNPLTIGTANGLSLSTQVLSLALATTAANGALSSTDKAYIDLLKTFFEYDSTNNAIKALKSFYSTGEVSAYGIGSGGGGGSYDRLDAWVDYDSTKSGWVLSALLGNDLNTRVGNLEGGSALTVNTTGTGNAITSISKAGTVITANKDLTFLETSIFNTHNNDNVRHITGAERTKWDGVVTDFGNLEIGGRNLLLNSGIERSNNSYNIAYYIPSSVMEVGQKYTITALVTPASGVSRIGVYTSQGYNSKGSFYVSGIETQLVSLTFSASYSTGRTPEDDIRNAYIYLYRLPNDGSVTGNTTIHWIKLEKGNKATDWTPAPEDQVSDWNTTDVNSFSYIKNKPTLLSQFTDNIGVATHIANTSNPHSVTKAQVGLGNVDNTADSAKNVLSATKLTTARTIAGVSFDGTANIAIPFANLSSKPTTLSGYGITDAVTTNTAQTITGEKTFSDTVTAPTFSGALSGNASSATKLQTPRTIWGQSFDGTGNVSGLATIGNILVGNGSGNQIDRINGILYLQYESSNHLSLVNGGGNVGIGTTSPAYKLDVSGTGRFTGNVTAPTFIGALNGNASSATKLQTARTIWGQSFDGTGNVTGALSGATTIVASTSVTSPKVIFNTAGWSMEQVGSELHMKHNNVLKMRFTSTGSIVATEEITAFGSAT